MIDRKVDHNTLVVYAYELVETLHYSKPKGGTDEHGHGPPAVGRRRVSTSIEDRCIANGAK